MAFWRRIVLTPGKCWHGLRVPLANHAVQFSSAANEAADTLIQEAGLTQEGRVSENDPKTFEELFKKSTFVALGNPKGKIVVGTIKKIVENNVYIDFGWKFPCVCTLPAKGSESYIRGKKVRVLIKELELASKFLGSKTEMSLNEADCVLLGLIGDRSSSKPQDVIPSDEARQEDDSLLKSGKSKASLNIEEIMLSRNSKPENVVPDGTEKGST